MNTILIFLISFFSSGEQSAAKRELPVQEALTTYYFIRHAEKDNSNPENKDPELSPEGLKRAESWATVFKEVDFDIILSTNYNRTRTTASKIAETQQKEVEFYDPQKLYGPEFQQSTTGKTVLVVGHSNTSPAFVNQILKEKKYKALPENEYRCLFIVTVAPDGNKFSQKLYIN